MRGADFKVNGQRLKPFLELHIEERSRVFDTLRTRVQRLMMRRLAWMHPALNLVRLFFCGNFILYIICFDFIFFVFYFYALHFNHVIETLHHLSVGVRVFAFHFYFIFKKKRFSFLFFSLVCFDLGNVYYFDKLIL